ncbi:hypothetical protein LCGC14_1350360 [marine sediment metagenome]|uniref:Uncharacterized protein n=1 Tax=marine sediment metagenome TaxID=412755 RepID=A0A0F9MRY1_9ZZZZ
MALTLSVNPFDSALLTEAGDKIQAENLEFIVVNSGYATIGAKGQVFYEFKRRDFEVTWSDNATVLKATITGDVTSSFTNGDTIFLGADTNYNEVGTVASAPAFGSGVTTFDTSVTFIAIDTQGYINNLSTHTNYRVEIQVWNDGVTTQLINEAFEYVPKQSGFLNIDLSDLMLFILRSNDILSKYIAIKWREVWNEDTTDVFNTATSVQVVHGVKPQAINGTFLSINQTFVEFSGNAGTLGRWLTLFPSNDGLTGQASKLLFKGWANFMYYLVDDDFNTRTTGDPETEEYSEAITGGTALLTGPTSVAATVTIVEHEITNNNNSAWAIQLQIKEDTTNTEVFESYTLQNAEEISNPIMIQWLNSLGGRDQWLFQYNQEVKEQIEGEIKSFSSHSELFEDQPTRSISTINAELMQSISVQAPSLTRNQFNAMRDIFISDDIDVWLKKDASKKKGCIVDIKKMSYQTKHSLFDLSIVLEFEPGYDLFRNLEY